MQQVIANNEVDVRHELWKLFILDICKLYMEDGTEEKNESG